VLAFRENRVEKREALQPQLQADRSASLEEFAGLWAKFVLALGRPSATRLQR